MMPDDPRLAQAPVDRPVPAANVMGAIFGQPWTWIGAHFDPQGNPTAYILPTTPANAPGDVREGTTLRREAMLQGRCPCCGARRVAGPNRTERRRAVRTGNVARGMAWVHHRPGCPGGDRALTEAVARWEAAHNARGGAL